MIIKTIIGSGFKRTCMYVAGDLGRSKIIASNHLRDWDLEYIINDFNAIAEQRPGLNKNMLHAIISFPKNEQPDDVLLKSIGNDYMKALGFENAPFLIAKHFEKEHLHLHIVASFLTIDNKLINRGYIGLRSRDIARQLEKKYGLQRIEGKNLSKTNVSNLRKDQAEKYRLYAIISKALTYAKSFDEFQHYISQKNIELKLKYRGLTNEVQGISFKSKNSKYSYKGSEIDSKFSYKKICQKIELNNSVTSSKIHQIDQVQSKSNTLLSVFFNILEGAGTGYSYNHFPTATKPNNIEDEEDLRKRKKKRKSKSQDI